ncbi:hypothetical protein AOLI_G00321130 [Acnodon oligacanthus]
MVIRRRGGIPNGSCGGDRVYQRRNVQREAVMNRWGNSLFLKAIFRNDCYALMRSGLLFCDSCQRGKEQSLCRYSRKTLSLISVVGRRL